MNALPFKIPKTKDESFKVQEDKQEFFYDYLHTHPEIQITYILSSIGTRFIGHSIDSFSADEIYVIGSNIPHIFKNDEAYYQKIAPNSAHCISLFFREDSFGEMFHKVPELANIRDFIQMSAQGIKLESQYAIKYRKEFYTLNNLDGFDRFQVFLSLLQKLASSSELKPLSHSNLIQQDNENEGQRLNKIITFVTQNFSRKITIEEIATEANLSISAFCRYFKLHTRKSFISFLNEFRVGIACKKLLEKNKNISEICYQTGFNNISNFNRQFKALTGFTPSQYLKQGWL